MSKKIRGAILGGSESGKTYLAIAFSRWKWKHEKKASLVFDPFKAEHDWGRQALVFDNWELFEKAVFASKGFVIIWDEGTSTGGRDRENLKFFTLIRHNHADFFFIGHGYSTMLPIMRRCLTDLYLFKADEDEARDCAKMMIDRGLDRAADLEQYQFLHKRAFEEIRHLAPSLDELNRGIKP